MKPVHLPHDRKTIEWYFGTHTGSFSMETCRTEFCLFSTFLCPPVHLAISPQPTDISHQLLVPCPATLALPSYSSPLQHLSASSQPSVLIAPLTLESLLPCSSTPSLSFPYFIITILERQFLPNMSRSLLLSSSLPSTYSAIFCTFPRQTKEGRVSQLIIWMPTVCQILNPAKGDGNRYHRCRHPLNHTIYHKFSQLGFLLL